MLDLAIVGGGPGGLMSAWYLKRKLGDLCRVTIYEASDRLGGKIVTRKFDSAPAMYEAGVAEIYDYSMTGPDPLREDADPGTAWARIRRSRAPIGGLLMDQSVLSGVGNVYRAEVLFRHRMDPYRPGNTLRVGQWRAMWDDLVVLMDEGVETGTIDTVRPEHTPEAMGRPPRADDHGGEVYVYRRAGQACLVCGSPVRTEILVGRNLFWCAHCQPRFRSRAVQ